MQLFAVSILAMAAMGQDPAPPEVPPAPAPVAATPAAVLPLTAVRTVYLLPMSGGFDQYLANHLTRTGAFEVVVDAALADVVVSAQVGAALQEKLKELYPPPGAVRTAEEEKAEENSDAADQREFATMVRGSGFSRGRGNVFLVDPRSQRVLWSTWLPPKSGAAKDLDKAAESVVKRLERDLKKMAGGA